MDAVDNGWRDMILEWREDAPSTMLERLNTCIAVSQGMVMPQHKVLLCELVHRVVTIERAIEGHRHRGAELRRRSRRFSKTLKAGTCSGSSRASNAILSGGTTAAAVLDNITTKVEVSPPLAGGRNFWGQWEEVTTGDQTYYYSHETRESMWDRPKGWGGEVGGTALEQLEFKQREAKLRAIGEVVDGISQHQGNRPLWIEDALLRK
jgi:hypothetical protein